MTGDEYNEARQVLKLTHEGLAELLGVGRRQSIRWGKSQVPVPKPVEIVLKLLLQKVISADDLRAMTKRKRPA